MNINTNDGEETEEVPPLSEIVREVEQVLGPENLLQEPSNGRNFPDFRLGGFDGGTIIFLDVDDLDGDTVDELVAETHFEETSRRSSLQCRTYFEAVKAKVPA